MFQKFNNCIYTGIDARSRVLYHARIMNASMRHISEDGRWQADRPQHSVTDGLAVRPDPQSRGVDGPALGDRDAVMNTLQSETTRLSWLVNSRRDVQRVVLGIMELGVKHKERFMNEANAEDLGVFASLVGASFGLWRSAFLLSDSAQNPNLLDDSLTFVRHLVRNNAVGYIQDVATHDWSAGYYLNNTVLRLNWVLSAIGGASKRQADVAVRYDLNVHRPKWERELRRLCRTVNQLAARLGQSSVDISSMTTSREKADEEPRSPLHRLTSSFASKIEPSRPSADLRWLVESRKDVLSVLIDLIDLASDHRACFGGNRGKKYVRLLALLIGAGYGLWRSGYLLSESVDRPNLLENAIEFLDYIVRNNTIGYMQDMNTQDWAGGHYLTNATLRLNLIMPELAPCLEAQDKSLSFKLVIRREEWEHEFDRLRESVRLLTEQLAKEDRRSMRIPAKANVDSEGNADSIPDRMQTVLVA